MGKEQINWDTLEIGYDLGTIEVVLDDSTVNDRVALVGWQDRCPADAGLAPPGVTIWRHWGLKIMGLPAMHASIWAKSEHEFLAPMRIGEKLTIRGQVIDKFAKRGRNYMVTEFETRNQDGDVLMRSRETGVWVE